MKEPNEALNQDEDLILEDFPFPKLMQLMDFFLPKTKNYRSLNWRKYLKIWARWAPWLTVVLLIAIFFIMGTDKTVFIGIVAFMFLIFSLVRFIYLLVMALVAKCLRRSPIIVLSLTPIAPLYCVGLLSVFIFFHWLFVKIEEGNAYFDRVEAARKEAVLKTVPSEKKPELSNKVSMIPKKNIKKQKKTQDQQDTDAVTLEYVVL